LGGTKKQREGSNKIGFFTTREKTYWRNLKSEERSDYHDTPPDKQVLTAFWESTWGKRSQTLSKTS